MDDRQSSIKLPALSEYNSHRDVYKHVFNSGIGLSKLRDAVLEERFYPSSDDGNGIAGRSIVWKLFLIADEPLQAPSTRESLLLKSLRSSRENYTNLASEKIRAPDGSYEGTTLPPGSSTKRPPRLLHSENPWREWFTSVDLRKTIFQDVERTFPEMAFFRDQNVQLQLTNILFLWSITNPDIGYRQGMHELLAPLYYAIDYDAVPHNDDGDPAFQEICSRTWVVADAWAIFTSVMCGVSRWYEWREPSTPPQQTNASSPLDTHVRLNVAGGDLNFKHYIAPIVQACNCIQTQFLKNTDPLLWSSMQTVGIEPQIYGIRWLRLLFTREFSLPDAMKLWDGIFASDPTFDIALWICVAMLIRIRNELIPADYGGQLTVLLHYPTPSPTDAGIHHMSLLLRQALALQMSPTPSTGVSIIAENYNFLNIPLDVPATSSPPQRRPGGGGRHKSNPPSGSHPGGQKHPSNHMGIPELIARGLMERGESLGINKTLMSAVSELRRNIPDIASSLLPPDVRPPWEPRTRLEMEREVSQLRMVNKRVGDSLSWIVDVLLQDETDVQDVERLKKRRREALESLAYIRDVMQSNATTIEEERLGGPPRIAPWNHSRSNFSEPNPRLSTATLPRLPPPTSTTIRRPLASSATSKSRDQTPHQTGQHDPLGVL
ncbi:rab-GTPase-TBC domain-containing protein [Infundibulicybe gibba]|nr:rab-GTPase-TBC domain-containing protein [Infundibulicybe gibba]